jgi:hypothetical protein
MDAAIDFADVPGSVFSSRGGSHLLRAIESNTVPDDLDRLDTVPGGRDDMGISS